MTRDDIVRMAHEAGWPSMVVDNLPGTEDMARLERFADAAIALEREACAKVCEARYMGDNNREDMEARRCAAAIRARGNA